MRKSRIILTLMLATLLTVAGLKARPANAQLLLVESKYRVVDVDKSENRIRVALPGDDPDVGQNWVYIDRDTRGSMRIYHGNGTFSDEQLTPNGILNAAAAREGDFIKVSGGRDWDGSINAKSVWM